MGEPSLDDEGVMLLFGEIGSGSVEPIIRRILEHNLRRDRAELRLYINSPGGSLDQGFALLDIMAWSRIPIHTTGMGLIASMGLLVLMGGARGHRTLLPRASVLSHRFSTQVAGTHADLLASRVHEDQIYERILAHYTACTGISDRARIEAELLRPTDRWLTADEAVAHGLADRILASPPRA
jgi:ATP-dependent Clp protease protease subunit